MWEFFGKVVDSLPPWFIMAFTVFSAGAALYLLPRVRRDKKGKLYLFSRSYEYQKKRSREQAEIARGLCAAIESLNGDIAAINKMILSIECENLKAVVLPGALAEG
jgi:hypothetical protein